MPSAPEVGCLVWQSAGGDQTRRGLFARAVQIETAPSRHLEAQGAVQAAVVFDAERRTFVADMAGGIQAFSLQGELLWRQKVDGGIAATPVALTPQATVVVGTLTGWVYALDAAKGTTLWRKQLSTKADPRILSDLLFLPSVNLIILSSWGGRFHALEAATGVERFSWDGGISPYAAAAATAAGDIYSLRAVATRGIEFVRLTAKGQETVLHQFPEGARGARRTIVAAAPVLDEPHSTLYLITNQDKGSQLHQWSLASNRIAWSSGLDHSVQATPALTAKGVVLVPDLDGSVHGFGPDGTAQFQYRSGCEYLLAGAVSEPGGTSWLGDPIGVLHRIDARGRGTQQFQFPRAIQARPSFDPAGNLYVPRTDGRVSIFTGTLVG